MGNERKKLRFEVFLERYFGNFHRILLTNLLFAIPSAIVFAAFYVINNALFSGMNVAFSMLIIVFLYPFYSGVVMVTRNIARGDDDVEVLPVFLKAVKDNFPRFCLHGIVMCAAALISYLSLGLYIDLLSTSWIMYVILFFCILIVLLVLYASFYLPLMSVTYDLKLRYLYKNSLLMSFGEFKNNFFATIAIAIIAGICFTATAFSQSVTVLAIIVGILWALFIPATYTFCNVFFIYDGMVNIISNKDDISSAIDKKISSGANKSAYKPVVRIEEDFSDIDISSLKDTDDFIFHNGRMVKQSTLLRILREREANPEVNKDE